MSVKVMTWVWEHSPVAGNERLVLLAIADNADDAGSNAWPSVRTLAHKTRLDARTVQRVVRRLCEGGHLKVTPSAGRGGANLYQVVMHHQPAAATNPSDPVDNAVDSPVDNHGDPWQAATPGKLPGAALVPPTPRHQCRGTPGTAMPPERPYVLEPPPPAPTATTAPHGDTGQAAAEKPAQTSVGPEREPGDDPAPAGRPSRQDTEAARRLLAELPAPWGRLSRGQRRQLAPLVVAALRGEQGRPWPAEALAAYLSGGNTAGIRSAYAVLQTRLRDLPDPPTPARTVMRPEHCGVCYEPTRHREDYDGRPYPCPQCHPDPRRRAAGAETETRLRVTQAV